MDRTLTATLSGDLLRWRADTPGCSRIVHLNNAGAGVALAHQLAHAREAHRDQRELRRGKETVKRDQRENANEANSEHKWSRVPLKLL